MRYDSTHKAKTRERVLHEASTAIRAEGLDHIGVAAIMGRAGLTHGGFYAHFKSKDNMVAEAIAYMFEKQYAVFLNHLDTPDPRLALTKFVKHYLSMRHRDATESGCPIPVLASDVPRLPMAVREQFMQAVGRLTEGVATLLERLGIADPHARAGSLLSELVGALALARIEPDAAIAETLLASSRISILRVFDLDQGLPKRLA